MASNYPTSLDTFSNPSGTDSLNSPSHSLQHADINDAVEALETKIGIGDSPAGSATAGQVLTAQGGGTAIWANAGGLVLIETSTFSAVAAVNVDDVFSATYDNYKIFFEFVCSTGATLSLRLRVSASDDSTSNYQRNSFLSVPAGIQQAYISNATSWGVAGSGTARELIEFDLINPFASLVTVATGTSLHSTLQNAPASYFVNGYTFNATTSFDGLSLITSTGTITGSYSVLAYAKA